MFDAIRSAIASDLAGAMRRRDRLCVAALRTALHALDNATAAPAGPLPAAAAEVPRRLPSATHIRATLQREIDALDTASAEYERLGQASLATDLSREADVIRGCLRHLDGEPGTTAP